MLVLSRKVGERVVIGGVVVVTVMATGGRCVRLGIEAPQQVRILREEIALRQSSSAETKGGHGSPVVIQEGDGR
ncbi:MAG: carbon storage regulator [Gemmataceae bacterium]|nr:carbon storage regulator [Gemmataceae bacterium]